MNWHVLFDLTTGEARSICTTESLPTDEEIMTLGLGRHDAPPGVDARRMPWDAVTRTLGPEPVPPVYVDPADLIAAFLPSEWAALKASSEPVVQHYYDQITGRLTPVNVASRSVSDGFTFLVARGMLTQARADEILTSLKAGDR